MTGYVARHLVEGEVYVVDHLPPGRAIVVLRSGKITIASIDNLTVTHDQVDDVGRWLRLMAKQDERRA